MKKIYLLLISAIICASSFAQAVLIADNAGYSGNSVVGQMNYHASESIYTDTEIGPGNYITAGSAIQQVFFQLLQEGLNNAISNYRIYMKNIPALTTTVATGAYSTAGYTQVYNGVFNATPVGYVFVNLTTPFVRTAGSNLEVLIERVDNVLHTNIIFATADGLSSDPNALSSRRYNGVTAPVSGTTVLTSTIFRPTIAFNHTFPVDAVTSDLFFPRPVSCYVSPQPVSVEILNAGTTNIAIGAASVTLHIRGANTFTATATNPHLIAPNSFDTVTFNNINLNNLGINFDTAYVTLASDGTTYNDTISTASSASSIINTLPSVPIVEDAEVVTGEQLVFSYVTPLAGPQAWFIQSGPYTYLSDGVSMLAPESGSQFFLFDSYDADYGTVGRLYSKCISLPAANINAPNTTGARLTFQMSHDSESVFMGVPTPDSLYVSVSNDHGTTWTRILPGYARLEAGALAPFWRMENVNLDAYAGQTVQIGFEGVGKFGEVIGLDDIHIDTTFTLPITLVDFTAQRSGAVNKLSWRTSQEVNSNKYIIERSTDGGRNYFQIGEVAAAGFSSSERTYHYTDASPVKGINYYRLRIIDLDNSYKYSVIRNVRNLGVADLSFAPNPVQQQMKITLDAEKADKGFVSVTDMSGRQVYTSSLSVNAGTNLIYVETGKLSPGSYIIKVQLSDDRVVKKFNKL